MSGTAQAALDRVATALAAARRVAVLTGAGMSAASGLPTYRGIGGLYNDMVIDDVVVIPVVYRPMVQAVSNTLTDLSGN